MIKLSPREYEVLCLEGETVLNALLRSGFHVFYGCCGGGCGTCKMLLSSGSVDYGRYSKAMLTDEERKRGYFLSCQASPLSDLEIGITEANRLKRRNRFDDRFYDKRQD